MGNNVRQRIHTFLENANAISDGVELNVGANMVLTTIAVTGNATNFSLVFEGKANDTDNYTPILSVNMDTGAITNTATANGKYQVDLIGLVKFRTKLSVIGTGALTSKGTVTN